MALALVLVFIFALLAPAAAGAQHFPADEDLELMIRYLVEDGETPGAVLGVLDADGATRIVSYGSADPDAQPLGPRSVFEIGSITKTFTATLLADMVLRGEVALEDRVAKYLPDDVTVPSRDGREITLLDLATHRSGLPNMPDNLRQIGRDNTGVTYPAEDAYAFLLSHELRGEPGAEYEYSNFGFGLLGHALGRAAGSSYRELVRTRILEPLGMVGTGFVVEGGLAERMTRGHRDGEPVRYRTDLEFFDGTGGLRSNAEDLLKYMKAHVVPPETGLERAMRMAMKVRVPRGDDGGGYGFTWGTVVYPGEAPVVTHGGGTVGFQTQIAFMPDRGIGAVLLANDATFADDEASRFLMALLYPDPPPEDWGRVEVVPEVLVRYAGEYESASGRATYYVRLEGDGHLTYQPDGRSRTPLFATSDTTFYMLRGPWSFTFQTGEGGQDVTMIMEVDEREASQAGGERAARKGADETPPPAVVAGNAPS